MAADPVTFKVRQIARLRVVPHAFGVVAVEAKPAWWAAFWFILALFGGLYYYVDRMLGPLDRFGYITLAVVAGSPLLIGFLMLSYHARVVIDRGERIIRVERRFLLVPIWRRTLGFDHARIVGGDTPVWHSYDTTGGGHDSLGCLTALAGPIGLLIEGVRLLFKYEARVRQAPGLWHVDGSGHATPLLIFPGSRPLHAALRDIAAADPDLVDVRYRFGPSLGEAGTRR